MMSLQHGRRAFPPFFSFSFCWHERAARRTIRRTGCRRTARRHTHIQSRPISQISPINEGNIRSDGNLRNLRKNNDGNNEDGLVDPQSHCLAAYTHTQTLTTMSDVSPLCTLWELSGVSHEIFRFLRVQEYYQLSACSSSLRILLMGDCHDVGPNKTRSSSTDDGIGNTRIAGNRHDKVDTDTGSVGVVNGSNVNRRFRQYLHDREILMVLKVPTQLRSEMMEAWWNKSARIQSGLYDTTTATTTTTTTTTTTAATTAATTKAATTRTTNVAQSIQEYETIHSIFEDLYPTLSLQDKQRHGHQNRHNAQRDDEQEHFRAIYQVGALLQYPALSETMDALHE